MGNLKLVRNAMFNANGIRNDDVDVKKQVVEIGNEVITIPKHTARRRNTMFLTVERTPRSSARIGTIKVRRTPHETHAGLRVHRLSYGAKWYQRGRYAR